MTDGMEKQLSRAEQKVRILERMIEDHTRELFAEREKYRQMGQYVTNILDTMTGALFVVNGDLCIDHVNSSTIKLLGYSREEICGKPVTAIISMREVARFTAAQATDASGSVRTETNLTTKAGNIVPVLLSTSVMHGEDPTDEKIVCVAVDITQQKSLENQLLQSQKLESVGQLAAGIAHELNTPIQYITDNMNFLLTEFTKLSELLKRSLEYANTKKETEQTATEILSFANEIDYEYLLGEVPQAIMQTQEGAAAVTRIVRAMKEFSHPGSASKIEVDINRTLESVATISKNEWKYVADIEFEFAAESPRVQGYPGELSQTFLNLIVNAAHAVEDANKQRGVARGTIKLSTSTDGRDVIVKISDTGTGIPESVKDRIFDPFFTTKEVGKGSGQGLAMAYATIVRHHEGSITFETTEGVGTTFIVKLPVKS